MGVVKSVQKSGTKAVRIARPFGGLPFKNRQCDLISVYSALYNKSFASNLNEALASQYDENNDLCFYETK